jgi:hypothetical protein
VAAGLAAVQAGKPDPFLPLRLLRMAGFARAERRIQQAFQAALDHWLPFARARVLRPSGALDPHAMGLAAQHFHDELPQVEVVLREVFEDAYTDVFGEPPPALQVRDYLDQMVNKMVDTPDRVFAAIKDQAYRASVHGWSMDELAAKIDDLLSTTGTSNWPGRAMTVARTTAIGAHNAGTHAGHLSLAEQIGGEWEHAWLATEDTRTRETHRAADLQRVPLSEPFDVGGFAAHFPHDPTLPPQELINCRCSELLVRPDEEIDLTDRQYRRGL